MKDAQCGMGEGINLTPTWVIGKLESILEQPSTVNLTLEEGSIKKNPDVVVNDVMMQEEKPSSSFVISETQNKTHLRQESQCHLRRTSTFSSKAKIGAQNNIILLEKIMQFLLNRRMKKDDVFFLSYKSP